MRMRSLWTGALTALPLLISVAAPALAVEAGKSFGDWQSECETPAGGTPRCFVSQTRVVQDQQSGKSTRLLKLSVGYFGPDGKAVLVAILPLGVDLRAGAALRIDDGAPLALTFQQCLQDGCIANMALDDKTLNGLRKSKGAQVLLRPYNGRQTVAIPVSTKGITEGLAALKPGSP